jgi:hypothetical protein
MLPSSKSPSVRVIDGWLGKTELNLSREYHGTSKAKPRLKKNHTCCNSSNRDLKKASKISISQ